MAESSPAQQQYPNLNPYASTNGSGNSVLNSASNTASSTMDSIKNSQTVQSLQNGPVADKAFAEADTTKNEFSNLAAARQTPNTQTSTGQNLTHYHSFFYNLLSWENPRATAISYVMIAVFIFATRYLPIVRYVLKGLYIVLGITAAAEVAGKLLFEKGFASTMRPKQYYTLPHETVSSVMEDLTELINFFVIEFQRIVFAENVGVTIGAFAATVLTYFLIKVTPPWGLTLLFTTLAYFVPLVYIQNRELIDGHVNNAQDILSKQTAQVRDLASQHSNKALNASQSAFKDYSAKASELVGGAKKSAVEKGYVAPETAEKVPGGAAAPVSGSEFPSAPKTELPTTTQHDGATEEKPFAEPQLS